MDAVKMATIPRQGFLYEILWDENERKMKNGQRTNDPRSTHARPQTKKVVKGV